MSQVFLSINYRSISFLFALVSCYMSNGHFILQIEKPILTVFLIKIFCFFAEPPKSLTYRLLRTEEKDITQMITMPPDFVEFYKERHHQCRRPFFEGLA